MTKQIFEIKIEHLKLLKRMTVSWSNCEFGAPCIDPKRPYGNSDIYEDMLKILDIKGIYDHNGELPDKTIDKFNKLHKETQTALEICLAIQSFTTGKFQANEYSGNWKKIL